MTNSFNPFSSQNSNTIKLVLINCIAFIVLFPFQFWHPEVIRFLAYNTESPIPLNFFTFITSIIVHTEFMHLLGNMLWLYFIGSILEDLIGKKHILWLFWGGGILGNILFASWAALSSTTGILLGASGGISAILLATAIFAPGYKIFLFGVIEVQLKWIAAIKIGYDLIFLFAGFNAGGNMAHLGGYIFGLLYILEVQGKWNMPKLNFQSTSKIPQRKTKVQINKDVTTQEEIDSLLDKINQSGYESLTKKEKEKLFRASNSK